MAALLISIIGTYGMKGNVYCDFYGRNTAYYCSPFSFGEFNIYVPLPVIAGFKSGIAIIFALGQIDNFFGRLQRAEVL
jgi:SulP family sulfate permease